MKRSTPGSHQKKFDLYQSTLHICPQTKESFGLLINGNLLVFKNHRKQAKINIVFYFFQLLCLSKPPGF